MTLVQSLRSRTYENKHAIRQDEGTTMNMHHQTELQRQNAANAAIKARLMNPPPSRREFEKLQSRIEELTETISAKDEEILSLSTKIVFARQVAEADLAKERAAHELLKENHSDLQAGYIELVERLGSVEDSLHHDTMCVSPREPRRTVVEIVAEVLKGYPGVSWELIKSRRRNKDLVETRKACIKAVYDQRPDLSSPAIGRIFNRDHTSVLYTVGRLPNRLPPETRGEQQQ